MVIAGALKLLDTELVFQEDLGRFYKLNEVQTMPSNEKRRKRRGKEIVLLTLFFVAIFYGAYRYNQSVSEAGIVRAHFLNPDGSKSPEFKLELATTEAERSKGLMYRKPGEMKPSEGMLFIYPKEEVASFWMKNTYISLDMIFLDSDLTALGILSDVPILNTESRSIGVPSRYVVELLAGTSSKHGIVKGSQLKLKKQLPRAVS